MKNKNKTKNKDKERRFVFIGEKGKSITVRPNEVKKRKYSSDLRKLIKEGDSDKKK